MKVRLLLFALIVGAVSLAAAITSAQRRPEAEKPITGDFKIAVRMTVAGNSTQSTTMIKGRRERTETTISAGTYNMTTVNITQCDMRRTIQVNDRARKYLITPMETDVSAGDSTGSTGASAGTGSRRGGVVTMTVNTVDTGERKEMFGFTARHLKRTTMMESSPDACQQTKMKIETDGWYINLEYGLSCPNRPSTGGYGGGATGCRDRYQYKTTGPANLGYPLVETTTMYGDDGRVTTTLTKEVTELSRQTLDAALFDVPAGYTEAKSQQEMYSSIADMMSPGQQQSSSTSSGNESRMQMPSTSNESARIRVGVVEINNKTKTSVSTDLREKLIAELNDEGIEGISLNASSPNEAVIEAQAKQCAYILYTDIVTLKAPSTGKKIGGIFSRATGVGSADTGKSEARLDFRLLPTASASPTLRSSASAKEETLEVTLNVALEGEARAVAGAIPRN
jgi:hypothetical protein